MRLPSNFFVSGPCQLNVLLRGLLGLLLEGVQDVNGIGKLRNIKNPELTVFIFDSDFIHALADIAHWLPVGWFKAVLDLVELITGLLLDFSGKLH
jgi:hypothetical protein